LIFKFKKLRDPEAIQQINIRNNIKIN